MQYNEKTGYKSTACIKAKLENIEYYPFHIHKNDIEIICILNGDVTICDSAATYRLSYGDVYIFNRNDAHKITSDNPDTIILTIHIAYDHYLHHFPELENAYFICDTYKHRDLYAMDIRHLRFQLARLYYTYKDGHSEIMLEEYAKELLEVLLSQFQQYVYKETEDSKVSIARLQNYDKIYTNYDRMYRIVDYVFEHYYEKLSLQTLADREFLSTAHISRYLKSTLGLTFSQLLSLTRCEEASKLLSGTDKTVDQIATAVGFSNRKHLLTQFKRWYDKSPSEYRNEILQDLNSDSKIRLKTFDYDFANVILNMYLEEC